MSRASNRVDAAAAAAGKGLVNTFFPKAVSRYRKLSKSVAKKPKRTKESAQRKIAAGLAVLAADTGRVLMLQRARDEEDPASGKWDFPGGHIDDGENPEIAAFREFAEETGFELEGRVKSTWDGGIYRGHFVVVDSEQDVDINLGKLERKVLNPDDPDGDQIEVVAWWDLDDAFGSRALRDELRASHTAVLAAYQKAVPSMRESFEDLSRTQKAMLENYSEYP